jgi:hypothetical protein
MAAQSTITRVSGEDVAATALACVKRHLPTLRQAYRHSGSRAMRLMLKDFELVVQRSEQLKQTE